MSEMEYDRAATARPTRAQERAKCAAEHITRARCRELIVKAIWQVQPDWCGDPRAIAIADRLLAEAKAETGEKP